MTSLPGLAHKGEDVLVAAAVMGQQRISQGFAPEMGSGGQATYLAYQVQCRGGAVPHCILLTRWREGVPRSGAALGSSTRSQREA